MPSDENERTMGKQIFDVPILLIDIGSCPIVCMRTSQSVTGKRFLLTFSHKLKPWAVKLVNCSAEKTYNFPPTVIFAHNFPQKVSKSKMRQIATKKGVNLKFAG